MPTHLQSFMAFDFGSRRTGCAVGTRLLGTARALASIHAATKTQRLAQALAHIRHWQPDALVVGVPWHPDGAAHENTARAQKFARQLHALARLPVYEVDERYSTVEALAGGAKDTDAAAACIILEQFLRGCA